MINKGQWREFGQDTGVTPLLFNGKYHGILERESGPRFNASSERWCFLQYSVPVTIGALGPTQTTKRAPIAGLPTPLPTAT